MNRKELSNFFKKHLEEYAKIDNRIEMIRNKMDEILSMEDDSMIQLNMGLCIFSVSKEDAQVMLRNAITFEQEYHRMMQERFNTAVGVINGE